MADDSVIRAADKILEAPEAKPELRKELEQRMRPRLVICQNWLESEAGWGQRPDGHTLHLTKEDHQTYVDGYNAQHNSAPSAPSEYTRPEGKPRMVKVTEAVYQRILEQKDAGVSEDDYPYYEYQRFGIWGHVSKWGPKAYQGEES
jgi:hypothetical protein